MRPPNTKELWIEKVELVVVVVNSQVLRIVIGWQTRPNQEISAIQQSTFRLTQFKYLYVHIEYTTELNTLEELI